LRSLGESNHKVGVIGYCSGGRQAFLAACSLDVDAAGRCVMCSYATEKAAVSGSGKGPGGWFGLTHVMAHFDHPCHSPNETR
jgi:dienelactone hydrolase